MGNLINHLNLVEMKIKSTLFSLLAIGMMATAIFTVSCQKQNDLNPNETQSTQVEYYETELPQQDVDEVDDFIGDFDDDTVIGIPKKYCRYTVGRVAPAGGPMAVGDVLCYGCPAGGVCWGGGPFKRRIRDNATGIIYSVTVTGAGGNCTTCPVGGLFVNGQI